MGTSSPTGKSVWPRSLYWRIVLSFCLCIGAVLAVQGLAVQLWLRSAPGAGELRAFTQRVAADLSQAITANPDIDLQQYLDAHYPKPPATIFGFQARDARLLLRGASRPPEAAIENGREFFRENPHPRSLPDSWLLGFQATPIVVDGLIVGSAGAMVDQSARELIGWRMAGLSALLLLFATGIAGRFVLNPVRRRLTDLQDAAGRYGAGDFGARVEVRGGDELAALAAAFNRMAYDLGARDEQLKAVDRTRRQLLADVSHELMTPLTAVRAYREVLSERDIARDPEAAHCLQVIADETRRLERLVGDLLDLSRLEAAGDSLAHDDVSVESLIGRVAVRHEPDARVKGITVSTSIGAGAEILYGDAMRLEQALQNLASNALRHTPPGGEIDVHAELSGETIVLSVRDSGGGIPEEHLPFVFDRFYKVDPSRVGGHAAGSGLGLSIVKAIVERHGGTVSAASEPGVATVFTICLPVGARADLRSWVSASAGAGANPARAEFGARPRSALPAPIAR